MVYANPRAFRFPFDTDFWEPLVAKAPTVMSAKFSSKAILKKVVEVTNGRVNLVPPVGLAYEFAQISPTSQTTCWMPIGWSAGWSGADESARRARRAAGKSGRRRHRLGERTPSRHNRVSRDFRFLQHSTRKVLMTASGYCKTGPIRPPYNVMPEDFRKADH